MRRRAQVLTGVLADVTVGLVFGERPVPAISLPSVASGDWQGFPFEKYDCRFTTAQNGELLLHCVARGDADPFSDAQSRGEVLNQPSSFNLEDGSKLVVETTNARQWG